MMRSGEQESGRAFRIWASLTSAAVALLATAVLGLAAAPTAFAAEGDAVPGAYERPLVAATAKASAEPVTFTISGMKYLEGRDLSAGEFSFRIAAAGAARIPGNSSLPKQLRGDTLSDAEKYELVAHGGLVYYPLSTQPLPAATTVTNDADGAVTFGPLTFNAACLGETATDRHIGTVFCYTLAEDPPRNPDGSLKDGVTRDTHGRYLYQGVAYDDSVKRVYLYVYETTNAQNEPVLAVLPLGDATFDKKPAKVVSGQGWGFLNIFHGAVLDAYDGEVYLEGQPITAGEFTFDVREVSEDGTVTDRFSVPCAASSGEKSGAAVKVLDDEIYGEPERLFYSVRQESGQGAEADKVVLDETTYNITVEVAKNADGKLEASVTHVRKQASEGARWVDVDLTAQPSPVVWENHLKATEEPGDEGTDKPGTGGADADKPGDGTGTGGNKPGAIDVPADTDKPDDGSGAGADQPAAGDDASDDGSGDESASGDTAPGDAASGDEKGGDSASASGTDSADDKSSSDAAQGDDKGSGATSSKKDAPGIFAQTGDELLVSIVIVLLIIALSGCALVLAVRHGKKRS